MGSDSKKLIVSYKKEIAKTFDPLFLTCIPHLFHFYQVITARAWLYKTFLDPRNVVAGAPIIRADYYGVWRSASHAVGSSKLVPISNAPK